jgi:hypothetical protein
MSRGAKLLTMMGKKNYEFRSKFHNFWSSREFPMNFYWIYKLEYFLNDLTNFTWIWNPNSYSLFEIQGWNQIYSDTKFEQNLEGFKSKPNLNWILFE